MPKFGLGLTETKNVAIARNQVFFLVAFRLPESLKERVPFADTRQLESDLVMGFYCDPVPGDELIYQGLLWRVRSRQHWPTRRSTQDKKVIARLMLDFVGTADDDE